MRKIVPLVVTAFFLFIAVLWTLQIINFRDDAGYLFSAPPRGPTAEEILKNVQ